MYSGETSKSFLKRGNERKALNRVTTLVVVRKKKVL